MRTSVKEYVGINSHFERNDGTRMSHNDIYTKVVEDIGLATCTAYMPVSREEIQKALEKDSHLNNIPLQKWDTMHPFFKQQLVSIGITSVSISDTVCTLKQAARMWAAD